MTNNNRTERENRHEISNLPLPGQDLCTHNHYDSRGKAENERVFEAFQQAGQFFEEDDVFGFFGRCAPCHVDFEEMRKEGLGDVQGDPAEEDGH